MFAKRAVAQWWTANQGNWSHLPLRLMRKALNATAVDDHYYGIGLVDFGFGGDEEGKKFIAVTREALELIRLHDPRRFRRVVKEVAYIVNEPAANSVRQPGTHYGEYDRVAKRVTYDYSDSPFTQTGADYELNLTYYASLIVHEATHGHLMSNLIPYTRSNYLRVERACHAEQMRFVRRLRDHGITCAANLITDFSGEAWEQIWHSWRSERLKRARGYFARTRSRPRL